MFKGKLVFLSLIAAALLCWQFMPAGVDNANSGIVYSCSSTAAGTGCCYLICPQGDGTRFDDIPECGAIISVHAADLTGAPIAGIIGNDIWLVGCTGGICLCGGAGSINADSATSAFAAVAGNTTISGDLAAGGCDNGFNVVIQGVLVGCPTTCLPYDIKSPDINCDLIVDIIDLAQFATIYTTQPGGYTTCADFDCSGTIDIVDFAIFGIHYLHAC
jgi:hypothetical protein